MPRAIWPRAIGTAGAAALLLALGAGSAALAKATAFPAFPKTRGDAAAIQWILNETNLPLNRVTAISDSAVFALVEGPSPPPSGTGPLRLRMREEVLNAETAKMVGGRSALMMLQLDCGGRRLKLEALEVWEGSNLQGAVKRQAGGDWLAAPPDSYLADVVAAGCNPGYKFPYSATAVAPVKAAGPNVQTASPPPAPAAPQVAAAQVAPAQAGPITTAPPPAAPPATTAAAALRPSVAPPPAPAAPPRVETAAKLTGSFQAQVGAFTSAEGAQAEMVKLAAAFPAQFAGRTQRVEPTAAAPPRMYRAVVGGFASMGEVNGFCTALRAAKHPCLVRR